MRTLKYIIALALTLMLVLALLPVAMADTPVLRIGLEQDVETIDPQQNTSTYTFCVTEGITEPLLREHNGNFLPGLAESYTTEDSQTWIFNIRKNACWSDGTPINAQDIVWSYREIFTRPESAKALIYFDTVAGYEEVKALADGGADADAVRAAAEEKLGISALDDYTVQIVLTAPAPYVVNNFCSTAWAPIKRDLYEQYGSAYGSSIDKMAVNGPFVVAEWRYNEMVVLEKNPLYWNAENIALDRVEIVIVQDVEPRVNMFKEGKLDYALASADYLMSMPDNTESVQGVSWFFMLVNNARRNSEGAYVNEKLSKLLSSEHFTAALNNGINRTVLYDSVLGNPSYMAAGYTIPGVINSNNTAHQTMDELRNGAYADLAPLTRNSEKAIAELDLALAEAGYASVDEVPEIKVVCTNTTDYQVVAEYLENTLDATLGLKVKMDATEAKVRDARVIAGDYDLMLFGWNNNLNDVINYLTPFWSELLCTGWNLSKPEQYSQYSALLEEITTTHDMDRRAQLTMEAEELLIKSGPIINLAFGGRAHLKSKNFENFSIRAMGPPFDYVFATPAN